MVMTLNLAPMVDVMMCLIIFFLLASKIVTAQHRPLELPYARAAYEIERSDLGPRVVINVMPDDVDPNRAVYLVQGWDGRHITERSLPPSEVDQYLINASSVQPADQPLRCVIRADRDVHYEQVELVLRACGLAKIAHVTFSARTGEEPPPAKS
jgi:biopolymer transport protein ExbD